MNVERKKKAHGFEVRFEAYQMWAINVPGNEVLGQYGRDRGYEIVYTYADEM